MTDSSGDEGLIEVLVMRLESQRLPYALALKEKVDRSERLNEFDIEFLDEALRDASSVKPLCDRHPEWKSLSARMVHLYHEITRKALENEQAGD